MEDKEIRTVVVQSLRTKEVQIALKQVVADALISQMDDLSKVSFVERQKTVQINAFINTEKLLYGFSALKKHLENEKEYLEMAFKQSSGSVCRYQKNRPAGPTEEQLLEDRKSSYSRSLHDYKRVKEALKAVQNRKGFSIIKLKYLSDQDYTYEDIADELAGTDGFSERLNEKTVRRYKNKLVGEIAVLLFGTDAI